MANGIPEETIELVRSQTDIVQVISEYLTLKKSGANYKACCPFHTEKTPSFMVSPAKQIYHCFGCGAGGNVFGFLMRQEAFTFAEAVKHLADRLGIQVKQARQAAGEQHIRERFFELHELATRFFRGQLLKSPEAGHARKYLQSRSLDEAAIRKFSIGYAPAGWNALISEAAEKGFSEELLLQAGLAKKGARGRVYDTFRNRIMFPICDLRGKVIAFGGRTLEEDQPKYINSPETAIYKKGQTLYNLHNAKKSISNKGSVIVVEGYTDLARLVLNGIENAVASLGTAFTQSQARLIKRYASEVILVFDSDSAGEAAASRGIEVLLSEDLGIKVATLPSGKDPDEFVLRHGAEAFDKVIEESKNFVEFHLESALAGRAAGGESAQNGGEVEAKIKTANTLATLLGKVPNPIRRDEYLRLAAGRLGIRPEILLEVSHKTGFSDRIDIEAHFEKQFKHEEKECMWLIKLLIERPEHIREVRQNLDAASLESEALREIFDNLFELEGVAEESRLLDRIQGEEAQRILSRLMFEKAGPESLYPIEWWTAFIKSREGEKRLSGLSRSITEAERAGNIDVFNQLVKEKLRLRRELEVMRGEMEQISVHAENCCRETEGSVSPLTEIFSREMARAEQTGDRALADEWAKRLEKIKK